MSKVIVGTKRIGKTSELIHIAVKGETMTSLAGVYEVDGQSYQTIKLPLDLYCIPICIGDWMFDTINRDPDGAVVVGFTGTNNYRVILTDDKGRLTWQNAGELIHHRETRSTY